MGLKTALYPGAFDPVHNGHIDIASRAAMIFDELVVGVYDMPAKPTTFSLSERVQLMREALREWPNIHVASYSGLTVNYARQVGAKVVVRGLRVYSDFELEYQMALANRKLAPEMDLICLMTSLQYSFLSSTIVKEIAKLGGCVDGMVPSHVALALSRKYHGDAGTSGEP